VSVTALTAGAGSPTLSGSAEAEEKNIMAGRRARAWVIFMAPQPTHGAALGKGEKKAPQRQRGKNPVP
jgi:hypothetical protein